MDIENQQIENTEATSAPGEASRDDLIAAVREAGGTASVDVDAEAAAAVERATAAGQQAEQATETPAEPEEPRIAAILRAREKEHAERETAGSKAAELIERARQESERMIQDARARAEKDWQDELARRRDAFTKSPTETLRALGDPQQIVDAVLRDGSPEARALQELQTQLAETSKKASVADEAKAEIAKLREQIQQDAFDRKVAEVRTLFTGQHATPEKTPYLYAEHKTPEGVFAAADRVATDWRKKGLQIGVDFDFDDVAQYVERETKTAFEQKLKALGITPAQQVSAGAAAKPPGNAPKVQANGTRTLSAANGSERRTSPKPLSEMTAEQQRQALIEEVAAARRANPDATS